MACRSEQYSGSTGKGVPWFNWAGLAGGNVETFYEPASLPDIVGIVQDAQAARSARATKRRSRPEARGFALWEADGHSRISPTRQTSW